MTLDVTLSPAALQALLAGTGGRRVLGLVGSRVRDEARKSAPFRKYAGAITTELGADSIGPFVDVGYAKSHPGFVLWWWEVGTRNHGARPHLRPALRPNLI